MSLAAWARVEDGALLLQLKVVPGAKRAQVVGALGDRLKVRVVAAPEAGRANAAVCAILKAWLAASHSEIVAGHVQPAKTARVAGVTASTLAERIAALPFDG